MVLLIAGTRVNAQDNKSSFTNLLNNYINIKNALVAGDGTKAKFEASAFLTLLNSPGSSSIQSEKPKLQESARKIAASTDLKLQREAFAGLSESMAKLAKSTGSTAPAIYIDYCPMKKAYWLSLDKAIKNPYYGNSMLTCGNISETIQR